MFEVVNSVYLSTRLSSSSKSFSPSTFDVEPQGRSGLLSAVSGGYAIKAYANETINTTVVIERNGESLRER